MADKWWCWLFSLSYKAAQKFCVNIFLEIKATLNSSRFTIYLYQNSHKTHFEQSIEHKLYSMSISKLIWHYSLSRRLYFTLSLLHTLSLHISLSLSLSLSHSYLQVKKRDFCTTHITKAYRTTSVRRGKENFPLIFFSHFQNLQFTNETVVTKGDESN